MNTGFTINVQDNGYTINADTSDIYAYDKGAYVEKNLKKIVEILRNNLPLQGAQASENVQYKLGKIEEAIIGLNELHAANIDKISSSKSAKISKLLAEANQLVADKASKIGLKELIPKEVPIINSLAADPTSRISTLPREVVQHVLSPMFDDKTAHWESNVSLQEKEAAELLDFRGSPGEARYFLRNLEKGFFVLKEAHPRYYANLLNAVFKEGDKPFEDRPFSILDLIQIKLYFLSNLQEQNKKLSSNIAKSTSPIEIIEFVQTMQGVNQNRDFLQNAALVHDWERFKRMLEVGIFTGINRPCSNGTTPLGEAFRDPSLNELQLYEICHLLMRAGADPNFKLSTRANELYPLEYAIMTNNTKVAQLLIDYGANISLLSQNSRNSKWLKELY